MLPLWPPAGPGFLLRVRWFSPLFRGLYGYLSFNLGEVFTVHPDHIYTMCGDFNRDIALIGRQNDSVNTPPQAEDLQWKTFTASLNFEYIPTNTTFSRQGGNNYTSTSLIDGFYINSPDNNIYSFTTNTHMNLNSYHYPITLHIPHNTLLARPITPNNNTQSKILNPIPPKNLEKFNIKFFCRKLHTNQRLKYFS